MADFRRSVAVVIGIEDYSSGIPRLTTPVNDAIHLAGLLGREHGYQVLPPLVEEVSRDRLRALFTDILPAEIAADDRLLVYFAGHGVALDGDEGPHGYLVPQDARPLDPSSLLSMMDLHAWLTALSCRHMLLILDCCFAGAFRWASTRYLAPSSAVLFQERYDRYLRSAAWQVLSSAAHDQMALDILSGDVLGSRGVLEWNGRQHSPFALALFQGLTGAADLMPKGQGDGVITATELYLYLRETVEAEVQKRIGREQTPGLWPLRKHEHGEFVFTVPGAQPALPPAPQLTAKNNPWRGLESYDEEHSALFFGRDEEIAALLSGMDEQVFTAVLGASGTGKSSLVKAGLLPRLRARHAGDGPGSGGWMVCTPLRPGRTPLWALHQALVPHLSEPGITLAEEALRTDRNALADAIDGWKRGHPGKMLLLTIDQFEELVTFCRDERERAQFLALLAQALDRQSDAFRLVITLRSDFEPQFAQDGPLSERWADARFIFPPMDQDDLRQVIEGPASVQVLHFNPDRLVDALINEVVQTPGALPLLSFTLREMYVRYLQSRREDRALTMEDYEALGGVIGSLRKRATEEYEGLPDDLHRDTMRRLMMRMVSVEGGELARRRVPRSELIYPADSQNERVAEVIRRLVQARLIVEGKEFDGEPYVEPTHDALVRAWDRLLIWQSEDQEILPLQRRLAVAAREWTGAEADARKGLLWDGDPRLPQVEAIISPDVSPGPARRRLARTIWQTLFPGAKAWAADHWLNRQELEFVQASILQRARNLRRTIVTVATVLIVLAGLTAFALYQRGEAIQKQILAEQEARRARAGELAAQAENVITRNDIALSEADPSLALLLAREAVRTTLQRDGHVTADARRALLDAIVAAPPWIRTLRGHTDALLFAAFSPDDSRVVTASQDGTARIWSVEDGRELIALRSDAAVRYAAFSPDAARVVTTDEAGDVRVWDATSGQQLLKLPRQASGLWSAGFSPDGAYLVTAGKDGVGRVWDAGTGQEMRQLIGHEGSVWTAVFSPAGDRIVTSSYDLTARIWDAETGGELLELTGHEDDLTYAAFSADGKRVITASYDETARVWDANTGKQLFRIDQPGVIYTALLSPQAPGGRILTAASDGTARVWTSSVQAGQMEQVRLTGHMAPVRSAAFNARGDLIVTAGGDGTARIWRATNDELRGHTGHVLSASFDPSGRTIATASGDFTAGIWDMVSGERLLKLAGHRAWVNSARFAPAGDRVVTAASEPVVRIWDAKTGKESLQLLGHEGEVYAASFSPDGERVLSAGSDGMVRIWDGGTGKELERLGARQGPVYAAEYSPDGHLVVSVGADRLVHVWQVDQGRERFSLPGHSDAIVSVAFSSDGKRLVTASEDGTARIWDLAAGKEVRVLAGHIGPVRTAAFSPDGRRIVTAGEDETARIWDTSTGQELLQLTGHKAPLYSASFSPDDRWVLTSSADWTVRLWPSTLDDLMAHAYRLIQRDPPTLTAEELRSPGMSVQPTVQPGSR